MTKLSEIGEFGFIDIIKRNFTDIQTHGAEGIGDDCAVIPQSCSHSYVVTSDMLVESKHFLLDDISPYELGYKTLAVNISDVASMGAEPLFSLLSIAIPKTVDLSWCEEFIRGYKELSAKYGVALIGGDTTSAPDGALTLNVTAIGQVAKENIKRRNMAQSGDIIAVSGMLGDSGVALRMILDGKEPSAYLRERHYKPSPHVEEGIWLGKQQGVRAMMDVSDGVSSDLRHICKASNVGAIVDVSMVPMGQEMIDVCEKEKWNTGSVALSSGEDYVLLLTIDPKQWDNISSAFEKQFGRKLYSIGRIESEKKIIFVNGKEEPFECNDGFTHF